MERLDVLLKEIRLMIDESRVSQCRVEEKAGLSRGYLSQLLSRQRELKVWQMLAILGALDCHPGEFFERADPMRSIVPGPFRSIDWLGPDVTGSKNFRPTDEATRAVGEIDRVTKRLQHLGLDPVAVLRRRLARCEQALAELGASSSGATESN